MAAEAFCPPSGQFWGLEVEWLTRDRDGRRVLPAQLAPLTRLPLPGGGRVSIEPGGQVELSSAPATTVDDLLDAVAVDAAALRSAAARRGIAMSEDAFDQQRHPERVVSAGRYDAMEAFFDARGPAGRWMMCNTAAVQVNISHDPGGEPLRWLALNRLAPVLAALSARSPGCDSGGGRWASLRQAVWLSVDPARTVAVPTGPDRLPVHAWADYALAADVMLVQQAETTHPIAPGTPFGDWLERPLAGRLPGEADLRYHLTTLFPPVRPRGWLELRALDAVPAPDREALTVLVAALMTPPGVAAVLDLLPDTGGLWGAAARHGLADPQLGRWARVVVDVATELSPLVTGRPSRRRAVRRLTDPAPARQGAAEEAGCRPDLAITRSG